METVTQIRPKTTEAPVRKPRFAYHELRPAGGIALTEWAIERQLSLASDYDERDLVSVLCAMNPDLDETIALDVDRLLDQGELVDVMDLNGRWVERDGAIDDYCTTLRKLALSVRGAR